MEKLKIKEEDKMQDFWYKDAEKMTLDNLPEFLRHLTEDYEHDYGTICHAMTAGSIATMWAINSSPQGGITGFQAGAIMWQFIKHWNRSSNRSGMRLVDYDDMLYPQYEDKFEKTISHHTWETLQKEALELYNTKDSASPNVRAHWKSIVEGHVPFGYTIKTDL